MAGLVLERINSAIHVLVQCYTRFDLFAKSKQNGLNKTSITLKREGWVAVATVRFEYIAVPNVCHAFTQLNGNVEL